MKAIEFETELQAGGQLLIPPDFASQLPETGKARVIVLFGEDTEDAQWRLAAYEQFMKEDSPEDSVYDQYP